MLPGFLVQLDGLRGMPHGINGDFGFEALPEDFVKPPANSNAEDADFPSFVHGDLLPDLKVVTASLCDTVPDSRLHFG
jgi:hypothetical protein